MCMRRRIKTIKFKSFIIVLIASWNVTLPTTRK